MKVNGVDKLKDYSQTIIIGRNKIFWPTKETTIKEFRMAYPDCRKVKFDNINYGVVVGKSRENKTMKTRKVVLIVQAEVGCGKTTLLNVIKEYLPKKFKFSMKAHSKLTNTECMTVSWEDEIKLVVEEKMAKTTFDCDPQPATKASEVQIGGDHYKQYKISPYKFLLTNQIPHHKAAIIRRILRYDHGTGGGIEDLNKIKHEIDLIIEFEEW